jgi:SAM-dependent methyltransferase
MSLDATGPNAEQITYWNEQTGPKWVALQHRLDEQISPFGLAAMERAGVGRGERALDVGCGCGQTSLQLALRVGERGGVTGIDISAPMLARAAQRAREAGLSSVRFEHADAQTHGFAAGSYDVAFSRFGVMFFADPPAAFANLRRGLAAGGRLAFVCWQGLERNPWMSVPLRAAARHVPLPAPPPPGTPGPFAFGDAERVRGILGQAGFRGIELEAVESEVWLGGRGSLDEAVAFALEGVGPTSALLREAAATAREAVRASVREALEPHATPDGVRMPASAWIATARAGDERAL